MNDLKWLKPIAGLLLTAFLLVGCGGGASDVLPAVQPPITGSAGDVTGTVVVSYNGATLTTNQGGVLSNFVYSDTGGTAQTTSVAVINGLYTLNGNIGGVGGFGGLALTIGVPANSRNWTGATQLSIQLAAIAGTPDLKVRIVRAGAPTDGCQPTYTVTGLTAQTRTFNIDLIAANFPLPGFCTAPAANRLFGAVITDVAEIQIEDNGYSAVNRPVGIRVGKIGVLGLVQTTPPPPPPANAALTCSSTPGSNAVASFTVGNTLTTVQGASLTASNYSGDGNASFSAFQSIAGCISARGTGGGGGFSGVGANVQLAPAGATVSWASGGTMSFPIASTNTSSLKVVLAGGTARASGSLSGGCFPTAAIPGVTSSITTPSFALNAAAFQLPGFCTLGSGETQASLLADALANLRQIQIEDNNTGVPVNMSFGTISREVPVSVPPPVVFTTLADISSGTFAQSPNDSFSDFPTITGNSAAATVFTATESRTKIVLYTGAGGVNISGASTLRLLSVASASSNATTAKLTLGKQPAGSCTITYAFPVTSTVATVDINATNPPLADSQIGQTDCTTATEIAAIKASVGDVQIRVFGSGTGPATLTLDAVQFGN